MKTRTTLALGRLFPLGLLLTLSLTPGHATRQSNWRVLVRIEEIRCIETEDFTGADEFYTLSAFTFGLPDGRQVVRTRTTPPISINSGVRKKGTTILDVTVPHGTTFSGELMGLDEDVSKDWAKVDTLFAKAGDDAAAGMKGAGGKKGGALGSLLKAAVGVIGGIATLDQDDILGNGGFPDLTLRSERTLTNTFPFDNSSYLGSDWNYKIRYSIKIEPSYNQPNL